MRDLTTEQIEVLDSVDEHDKWFNEVIAAATEEVLIVSPWITGAGIKRFDLCASIKAATGRGVRVKIFT